jgi:hypothetical protein
MSARLFISHRRSDGAGVAAALSRDLGALFDDAATFRFDDAPAAGERWREALAEASDQAPVLLAVITPDYFGMLDAEGRRLIERADDPVREELDSALAAGAYVMPLLSDGVAAMPPDVDLPAPFDWISRLPCWPLHKAGWSTDLERLTEALRERGFGTRPTTQPGTIPVPIEGPTTTPMPLDVADPTLGAEGADGSGRRGVLGMATVAVLLVGGWGVWRWQQRRAANLTGIWRTRIGLRGAPTSSEGPLMLVTLEQKDRRIGLASTVGIAEDPQWELVRDAWKERNGSELKQVVYRGEGEFIDEGETAPKAASAVAEAASESAASATPAERRAEAERARRVDPTLGMRRVVIAVRIAAPGKDGEKIDEGTFRGVVDISDQRIHGRLWLESEQAERVVDLRRGD